MGRARVVGFDIADGDDLLDRTAVMERARACDAVVHAGALAHDTAGTPERIAAVNVDGTQHVLDAAMRTGARVVYFSSAQVFGLTEGEHLPAYLPLDDDHPRLASRAYGRSKCEAEDLCAAFSTCTGLPSISLRSFMVFDDARYRTLAASWAETPHLEWTPYWELGAFVDVRDVAGAASRALTGEWVGSEAVSLCAADMAATRPAAALVPQLLPDVEWRGRTSLTEHGRAALVDTSRARRVLGWQPEHEWAAHATSAGAKLRRSKSRRRKGPLTAG